MPKTASKRSIQKPSGRMGFGAQIFDAHTGAEGSGTSETPKMLAHWVNLIAKGPIAVSKSSFSTIK